MVAFYECKKIIIVELFTNDRMEIWGIEKVLNVDSIEKYTEPMNDEQLNQKIRDHINSVDYPEVKFAYEIGKFGRSRTKAVPK